MRFVRPLALAVSAMLAAVTWFPATASGEQDGGKKGVSLTNVDGAGDALRDSGVGWYYDWASDLQGVAQPDGVEFVPMIWGRDSVTDEQLDSAKSLGSTLLAFNEPDLAGQAEMSVDEALDAWPRLEGTGMRLGAPAVAGGADQPGGWLDQFLSGAQERGYRVDFIPLHWYGGDFSAAAVDQLRGYLQAVHDRYGKPIWLTEYALTDFSSGTPRYPSPQEQTDFVSGSSAMLQDLPFVERYAWFTLSTGTAPTGLYDGATPNASGEAYKAG
ncbi:glycoside hydrolase family protein [Amycolatopsis jiangsuensis]|uniref:Asl1-like glycosyl hydrolase catalytic domain-containing protein n=1 Tax=Amycolatopsis jiangsuensis TaxID=1181879 RepID=A0A840IRN2_9PSEU|nr:glycoside hydrolase family protein [Amycolatopsis jiangsuensis]MBB4684493.1 hypothetical protein [Amycolatopsis jiangsuensis]